MGKAKKHISNTTDKIEIMFGCFKTEWFKMIAYKNHTNYSGPPPQHTQIKFSHEILKNIHSGAKPMKLSNLHCHILELSLLCRPDSILNSETMKAYKVQVDRKACAHRTVSHMIVLNSPDYHHHFGCCTSRNSTPGPKYNLVPNNEDC